MLPSSGEVVAIVRTEAEAHHVCREMRVFTLEEIGRLIEGAGADGAGGETRVSRRDGHRHPQARDRLGERG